MSWSKVALGYPDDLTALANRKTQHLAALHTLAAKESSHIRAYANPFLLPANELGFGSWTLRGDSFVALRTLADRQDRLRGHVPARVAGRDQRQHLSLFGDAEIRSVPGRRRSESPGAPGLVVGQNFGQRLVRASGLVQCGDELATEDA
ncbi:hypothetical protein [Accumulibacter sp.]|uniref:hypothetical protein n=1 Tax=Accumulibacter sp. TaxID=2053492 RepID=UPI0025DF44F8|nr:hypothetical protein [Accumulibacter sp.]MCM8595478.1 hypothetical protein [Accumulibacter sp.]MCM8626343.1 hypothetical protein [Accumulibacter sp.]MDS4049625.1 hypothetical protein [Accumulibacter sp.]